MEFGLDYYRDDVAGRDAANYFIPYAHLRFDLGGGGFVPYVELDGTLKHNDMRELMETNLYYDASLYGTRIAPAIRWTIRSVSV